MIRLERTGDVFVLRMDDGENRFNDGNLDAIEAALDEVAATTGPAALVTTGTGKHYSGGLDLDWMAGGGAPPDFVDRVHRLFGRMLAFPAITVAAVNGHAFAGGAMLATAHDFRVMRADRGYWCLPEVDLGLPLTPAMHAVIAAKLPKLSAHEAITTGRRYGGDEALAAGIVDAVAAEDEVLDRAVALAASLAGKDRAVVAAHKQLLVGDAIRLCLAGG